MSSESAPRSSMNDASGTTSSAADAELLDDDLPGSLSSTAIPSLRVQIPRSRGSPDRLYKPAASSKESAPRSATSAAVSEPPSGMALEQACSAPLRRCSRSCRSRWTRRDRVDRDRAAADLARERARERLEPALAGRVVRLAGVAHLGDHRRQVDDPAGAPLHHRLHDRLHTLQAPRRLVAITASKSSGFMRRISWSRVMPALFTAMSSRSCSWVIAATSASTASWFGDVALALGRARSRRLRRSPSRSPRRAVGFASRR